MTKLADIEGIGEIYADKLKAAGIRSVEGLLQAGANPGGRKELEEKTGIPHKLMLEWVNLADLMRIKGVSQEYSDLLEEAGVDTVRELRNRRADNLFLALCQANELKKLVRRLPTEKQVADWVEQAKALPVVVTY